MLKFLNEKIKTLGTAACPPYHLAIVIGGTSAELNLKTVKLASTRYLDGLPTEGNKQGRAFRDVEMEARIHALTQMNGIGAQFGGKYFCHDVRVIRLPRHGASCPIGIGVSCSADRQALGKITADGVFLEQLEENPAQYLPEVDMDRLAGPVVTDRSEPPDGRDPPDPVAVSGQDAARPERPDDRRARPRPRQDPRAAGEGRADAGLFQGPSSTTPVPPRPRRATRPAHSARRRPAAWIPSSATSWPRPAASSRWPRATARAR
jgi:hypothetical protein